MRQTNDLSLSEPGGPAKDTTTGATDRARLGKLRDYLRELQTTALGLDFSDKGRATICQRFQVSNDELAAAVAAVRAPRPGRPTPELLAAIGAAVAGRPTAEEGVLPAPALVNSRNKAEIESDFSEAHSRAKAGEKSEFSESLKREIDGIKTEQPPTPELLAAIGAAVGYPNGKGGKVC